MDDFSYPHPHSIRPKIILAKVVRFVIFDWKHEHYWTGEEWGKEGDARI